MEGLGLLFLLWIVGQVLEKVRGRRQAPAPERLPEVSVPPTRGRHETATAASAEEAWQRELEELFGVPTSRGPLGRPAPEALPPAEEVEERETLETLDTLEEEERLISLDEREAKRPEPVVLDRTRATEAVLAERVQAAARQERPLTRVDHTRFDAAIRSVPAPKPRERRPRPSLRQALVWKEILDPPLALRDRR